MTTLTIDELLEEIRRHAQPDDEGWTIGEWADRMGWPEQRARESVRRLLVAGRMVRGQAMRQSVINLKWYKSWVFRLA